MGFWQGMGKIFPQGVLPGASTSYRAWWKLSSCALKPWELWFIRTHSKQRSLCLSFPLCFLSVKPLGSALRWAVFWGRVS